MQSIVYAYYTAFIIAGHYKYRLLAKFSMFVTTVQLYSKMLVG